MTDMEKFDQELMEVMGAKFEDGTCKSANPAERVASTTPAKPVAQKTREAMKPGVTTWEPPQPEPNWMDNLKGCALSATVFGGLNMLIFYWMQAGLMAESIAVPSMTVCAVLAGFGVGKYATRGMK